MAWPAQVEQWREFAQYDARDVPAGLVLAIIDGESAGRPGAKGPRPLIGAEIPDDNGAPVMVFQALGLMQTAPLVISSYNQAHKPPATFDDMTGSDTRAARQQIRVGAYALAAAVNRLNKYDPAAFPAKSPGKATGDQIKSALAVYASGFEPIKNYLDTLRTQKRPLTFSELSKFQHGGIDYARRRWTAYATHEPEESKRFEDRGGKTSAAPGLLGLIAAFIIYKFIKAKQSGEAAPRLLSA
jgi:hypothetical protein